MTPGKPEPTEAVELEIRRVLISGNHPWAGYSGEIVSDTSGPSGMTRVLLDNGYEVYADELNLRASRA